MSSSGYAWTILIVYVVVGVGVAVLARRRMGGGERVQLVRVGFPRTEFDQPRRDPDGSRSVPTEIRPGRSEIPGEFVQIGRRLVAPSQGYS